MTAKRLAAFVATVVMIIGAIFARSALDKRSSSSDGTTPTASPNKGSLNIVCSTDLTSVCQDLVAVYGSSLRVTTEAAGITLDRLATADVTDMPDAWITLAPFPAMLVELRPQSPLAVTTSALAQTTPALTMLSDRAQALQSSCGSATLWRCIGDITGSPWAQHQGSASWGSIRPGFVDPTNEAMGLHTLANALSGYFDGTSFSRNTWEADPEFSSWIRNLSIGAKLTTAAKSPLATLITRSSAFSIAATDTAEVTSSSRAGDSRFTTLTPTPAIAIVAQLASFNTSDSDLRSRVNASLTEALVKTYGWERSSNVTEPSAGTFIALRQLWKELT